MFGSGPTEEIRLESKTAQQIPPDEHESQARFEEQLEDKGARDSQSQGLLEHIKRWFSSLR